MKIGTHDGRFHSDDVFGVAMLLILHPDAQVVRTRDEQVLAQCDFLVDVGREYNPAKGRYDHHQGNAGIRPNGIEYSSFGLLWKDFGVRLAGDEDTASYVEKALVQSIDARDNGQTLGGRDGSFGGARPFEFADALNLISPDWDDERDEDMAFMEAVQLSRAVLERLIGRARSIGRAREIVRRAIAAADDPRIIVLECGCPWQDVVMKEAPKALFVVLPGDDGMWRVQGIPKSHASRDLRKRLPDRWRGTDKETFAARTGVPDAYFVHNKLFICSARSRAGALSLAKLAL